MNKHLEHPWRKPISEFSIQAFSEVSAWLKQTCGPLILDSCCGIGESTAHIASRNPDARVLGFDRSDARLEKLAKKMHIPDNCLVIRADANDLWRQLAGSNVCIERHYILFPNPYPKAAQLNQRWHGAPVFPSLIALGGQLEVRSNWSTYLEEFSQAISIATNINTTPEAYEPNDALSAFEKKYYEAGQTLWRVMCQLPKPAREVSG